MVSGVGKAFNVHLLDEGMKTVAGILIWETLGRRGIRGIEDTDLRS